MTSSNINKIVRSNLNLKVCEKIASFLIRIVIDEIYHVAVGAFEKFDRNC